MLFLQKDFRCHLKAPTKASVGQTGTCKATAYLTLKKFNATDEPCNQTRRYVCIIRDDDVEEINGQHIFIKEFREVMTSMLG